LGITLGIVLGIIVLCSTLIANVAMFGMLAEVNKQLPAERQISPIWWHLKKIVRVYREHHRLCPTSNLRKLLLIAAAVMLISFLTFVIRFQR
jgi:hypothetical protein